MHTAEPTHQMQIASSFTTSTYVSHPEKPTPASARKAVAVPTPPVRS